MFHSPKKSQPGLSDSKTCAVIAICSVQSQREPQTEMGKRCDSADELQAVTVCFPFCHGDFGVNIDSTLQKSRCEYTIWSKTVVEPQTFNHHPTDKKKVTRHLVQAI